MIDPLLSLITRDEKSAQCKSLFMFVYARINSSWIKQHLIHGHLPISHLILLKSLLKFIMSGQKKLLHGESNEYMSYKSSYTSMAQVRGLIVI